MVKASDLLKLILVIQLVEFCCAVPLSEEANYESAVSAQNFKFVSADWNNQLICLQYDQEISGWIPVQAAYMAPSMYPYHSYQRYPAYNDRVKSWVSSPSKRNSELINSLLGLPKNMDAAGK